ncbi:GLYCOGENIN SUBFAMILY MEMBER [Salix koriyanagi]|uniref:Hexosyltransferase n=1 Tax=Salix koriyanagi TaxID=2511006 RepID=A0A9Q1A5F9_9ROSI|nr:GLYCOGENIN SUBFAMILY MEMBER [Salix koriyanagi]
MAPDTTTTFDNNTSTDLVKQASISSCAYVTFLAGDGDYWKGVVGLAKGLRKAESKYPLVVAILPDVPEHHRKILVSQGCILREIEPIHPPENQTQFAMAYYVINYSKLRIWEFRGVQQDDISGRKHGAVAPQYKIGYCQQCPDKVKWPAEMGPKPPLYFNAGMFVYEPNLSTYHDLLRTLKVTPPTLFAEQDFLNMGLSRGGTQEKKRTWTGKTSRFWSRNGGTFTMMSHWITRTPRFASSGSELQPILEALYEAGAGHYFTAPSAA